MDVINKYQCNAGEQGFYQHDSVSVKGIMKFGVYLPPQALNGQQCSAVFFLAGLTCTEETFAIKAHAQYWAAKLGLILVMPDTSPRGEHVADDSAWDLGQGAGFYINAMAEPWAQHYNMEDYVAKELYQLVLEHFPIDPDRVGIMGHSMGGHGALTLAYKYSTQFKSVSAFAPICAPTQCPWGQKAFEHYFGNDQAQWRAHDAVELIKQHGQKFDNILIDQGKSDQFYSQLNPELLEAACKEMGQQVTLRYHDGYDHGYYFIQSFIEDHLKHHAVFLNN